MQTVHQLIWNYQTYLHKIGQSGGVLLNTILKTRLSLIRSVFKPLDRNILILLGLTAVASAADAAIHKKMFWLGFATLIISNEKKNYIMKIVTWSHLNNLVY